MPETSSVIPQTLTIDEIFICQNTSVPLLIVT
jgi:hypothetical protein